MLRFFFWSLLILNAFLIAFNLGYLGNWDMDAHEPQRMVKQLNSDQLHVISASLALAPAQVPEERKNDVQACLQIGNFLQADASKIEDKLKTLALGDRQSRINVVDADTVSYMVFIPSQGSKDGADKKAGELRRLGITDFFIVVDQSNLRFGISLGVFKTEDAAKAHLNKLSNKGVHSARIGARTLTTNKFAYQLRALSAEEKARFDIIKLDFSEQDVRNCQSTAYSKN